MSEIPATRTYDEIIADLADHIHQVIVPAHAALARDAGITIIRSAAGRPPADRDEIARQLQLGHVWLSWLDDHVVAGLRELGDDSAPCLDCRRVIRCVEEPWFAVDGGGVCEPCAAERYGDRAGEYLVG